MKLPISVLLVSASAAAAYVPQQQQKRTAFVAAPSRTTTALRMSDDEEQGGALVPIKEETVEFAAGTLGAAAGFLLGGPWLAFIGGAAANYVSKQDSDAGEVTKQVSQASLQVFNYLAGVDKKYAVLEKTKNTLTKALDNLKNQGNVDPDAINKVEGALATTKDKLEEINDEYDLVGGGMTALGVIGDLVEKAVEKAGEMNEQYNLSDKAMTSLKGAVDKAKDAAKDASTSM